jgi:nucleoside-diphosphate-sugar epimerase
VKVLLVGGAGRVGSFIAPYLRERHELRVLDLAPPKHDLEFIEGSITDPEALRRALEGLRQLHLAGHEEPERRRPGFAGDPSDRPACRGGQRSLATSTTT